MLPSRLIRLHFERCGDCGLDEMRVSEVKPVAATRAGLSFILLLLNETRIGDEREEHATEMCDHQTVQTTHICFCFINLRIVIGLSDVFRWRGMQ